MWVRRSCHCPSPSKTWEPVRKGEAPRQASPRGLGCRYVRIFGNSSRQETRDQGRSRGRCVRWARRPQRTARTASRRSHCGATTSTRLRRVDCVRRSYPHFTAGFDGLRWALASRRWLWLAWPKRRSGIATDLDFEAVQRVGLDSGLVDNKVCAIDETWSGLRFVVRREIRADWT